MDRLEHLDPSGRERPNVPVDYDNYNVLRRPRLSTFGEDLISYS